jgi:transposase-like protein
MPEIDLIELRLNRHLIECPHCQEQTVHNWPGTVILFSPAKCTHCGKRFVIALNQPR